jgi:hypothetical protein
MSVEGLSRVDRAERSSLRRAFIGFALITGAMCSLAEVADAQSAQGVVLRLRPHVGDTLITRLEQTTVVSGEFSGTSAKPGGRMTTKVMVAARTIVQASGATTTTVLTVVDSADVSSSDAHGAAMSAQAERALRGQQLVLQLAEDGAVESAHDIHGNAMPHDLADAMSAMPAVLPHHAVNVGDRWERELPLPASGPAGARGSAHVRAQFRLDSLAHAGDLAFVSMRGEIVPDGDGQGVELTGTVAGAMRVDRVRGWMTDSHFSVLLRSLVRWPTESGVAPARFVTTVTQRLRTMDKR